MGLSSIKEAPNPLCGKPAISFIFKWIVRCKPKIWFLSPIQYVLYKIRRPNLIEQTTSAAVGFL